MNIELQNIQQNSDDVSIVINVPGIYWHVFYGFGDIEKRIEVHIESEGVEANILGVIMGDTGTCKINTTQHHKSPNSVSDLHIKSVLSGDASLAYTGMIRIDKMAQQSNAYQQHDTLMLSSDAHVDTRPELEIIANDVSCSHGATIGNIQEDLLFYMQARGIDELASRQLALRGFLRDIIMRVPSENVQSELNHYMKNCL